MYVVAIGWLYVAVMMSVAEGTSSNGSVLGAMVTFVLYGLLPVALVVYLLRTPARKRALKAREAAELEAWKAQQAAGAAATGDTPSGQPDAGGEAPAAPVAPVRKEA
ncbi:MAG TPA: hypothetical protein VLJ86_23725 [Ramlibacter sp.]|nr:hypothetical protein [Ramlibacter sp.]